MSLGSAAHVRKVNGRRVVAPAYRVWQKMKTRCLNYRAAEYDRLVVKGARIDPRWHAFAEFISDLGPIPDPTCSLYRRDDSVGYLPENCYWGAARRKSHAAARGTYNIPPAFRKWISTCV